MTVHLVSGGTITVLASGTIEYANDGKIYRAGNYDRESFESRCAMVRSKAWERGDVRFITSDR